MKTIFNTSSVLKYVKININRRRGVKKMKKTILVIGSLFTVFLMMMLPSAFAAEGNAAKETMNSKYLFVAPVDLEESEDNYGTTDYEPTFFIWTIRWIWKFLAALGLGFIIYLIFKDLLNLSG